MTLQRVITEFGTGNDLHGGDYTKAAVRAVQDAIHHSSLTLIRSLGVDAKTYHPAGPVGVGRLLVVAAAARDAPHHRFVGGPRRDELLHQLFRKLDPRLFDQRADLLGGRRRQMAQIAALAIAHP